MPEQGEKTLEAQIIDTFESSDTGKTMYIVFRKYSDGRITRSETEYEDGFFVNPGDEETLTDAEIALYEFNWEDNIVRYKTL